jgi:hypothetical protein
MSIFRNHILSRVFCVLMALHIFNVSVDMPDAQPDDIPEDLTINDQETVVELVLEGWLGIDNAIAEHDETGDESETFEIIKQFQLYTSNIPEISFYRPIIELEQAISYQEDKYFQYINEINPPPPKA